jgi:rhomboid family GlyGly-CTERM serine protease
VTLALVGAGLLFSFIPGMAGLLEYDRDAVNGGRLWRLLSSQLVHWTARMTLLDLGVILLLGSWLEMRSRKLLVLSLTAAALLVGAGLHLLPSGLDYYRGSSGLATALLVCMALVLLREKRRGLALLALLLLAAKLLWELWSGTPLAAGNLPHGVSVSPLAHLLGAIAGAGASVGHRILTPLRPPE